MKLAGYLGIVLVFFLLPPIAPITPEGMKIIGIFIAFVYGLTVTSDAWPSMLTLIILPLAGLMNFVGLLKISFGSDVVIFVMLSLVLVSYMESSGAAAFAATWLLKREFLGGHPWRLTGMLLFICWLISSFVNAFAGMMLTWVFLYEIFAQFNYKPFDKVPTVIIFGTCVVGGLGLSTLPWGNNSIVILDAFKNQTGIETNFFVYMGFSIPYSLMVIGLFLLMAKFLFRIDVSALKNFDPKTLSAESQMLTREKAYALLSMVALVAAILVPTLFPKESFVATLSNQFGLSGKLLAIFLILQLIRINGKPACNFVKNAKNGIGWGLMLIVLNIMIFSNLIGTDEVGINLFLASKLAPLFDGKPAILFIILALSIAVITTNFMANKIVAILMISITMPIASTLGVDLVQLVCLYTVGSTIAFMLPSASQSSTILFSNVKWIRATDVYKYGIPTIIMMTTSILIWNMIYFSLI